MDTKDIVLLILILFALILAIMVVQGQVNFAKLIETWEYEHVQQFNSPQIEIIYPRPFSYLPVTYNQTTHLYVFYILIRSNKLLYNYTPPITTSFPLHSLPITILFKTTEKDGHTYYIYKVILKTEHLNQYGDTITIQSNNFYQQVFFYPYVVNQNQNSKNSGSGSGQGGGGSGNSNSGSGGSNNSNSSSSSGNGSSSNNSSSNNSSNSTTNNTTNTSNQTISNQTNSNQTSNNNQTNTNNSTSSQSNNNSSNNSTNSNNSSGGGSGSSNNTLTNNSTLLSNITISSSNTTYVSSNSSYDNYVSGVWENLTVTNYNSTNSSTENLVKGNYINPPQLENIQKIVLAPATSLPLLNNNNQFAITSLFAVDTTNNQYRLFVVRDIYNNYHLLALSDSYLQTSSFITAVEQTTSITTSNNIVIDYDIFYYEGKIVRIAYNLQNNTFEAVKQIQLQASFNGQTEPVIIKDIITTPYYYIVTLNSNILLYLDKQTLQIVKVKQITTVTGLSNLYITQIYETDYQQHIAVTNLFQLVLMNKTATGNYTVKVFGSSSTTSIAVLQPNGQVSGYGLFKQDNTIFINYINSSGEYVTDFSSVFNQKGYVLHVKILNSDWKPLWPAGFNSEHVGGGWTALTFYNNQTQEFSQVFLLFNPASGDAYACEYNNVLSFSQGQGYLFNVLYNLITVTLFEEFENLVYSSSTGLNVIYNTLFFTCQAVNQQDISLTDLNNVGSDVYVETLQINKVPAFKQTAGYNNVDLQDYLVNSTVSITEQAESFYLYTVDNNVIYPISYYSPLTNGG